MMLPYGRQWIDDDDVAAVVDVLRSAWLTTGPVVEQFERAFADVVCAAEAVAVANGTAALHAAMYAAGVGPGDEVIVPAITFAATANSVVFQGGKPVFADVDPDTLLIDPDAVASLIRSRTKAIVAVDYAGQPCDYDRLQSLAERHGLLLIADACHAVGGSYKERAVGSLADLSTFSFHPVKHFTTGEGGMITTDDADFAEKMRIFRNHGITSDHRRREAEGSWFYEMVDLGFNYRLTDIQCALGISQLKKLPEWVVRRQEIARFYDKAFVETPEVQPLKVRDGVTHAYHLYVVRFALTGLRGSRADLFRALRDRGIGVNVHYIPVHLHPFYRDRFKTESGQCPVAEAAYEGILTLPIFPEMTNDDAGSVVTAVHCVLDSYRC